MVKYKTKIPSKADFEAVIKATPHSASIQDICSNLEDRFPWSFRPSNEDTASYYPSVALYTSDGQKLTDNISDFVKSELETIGSTSAFVEKYKPLNIVRSKKQLRQHLITAQISPEVDDLILLRVAFVQEQACSQFAQTFSYSPCIDDLIDGDDENKLDPSDIGKPELKLQSLQYLPDAIDHEYRLELSHRQHMVDTKIIETRNGRTGEVERKGILDAYR